MTFFKSFTTVVTLAFVAIDIGELYKKAGPIEKQRLKGEIFPVACIVLVYIALVIVAHTTSGIAPIVVEALHYLHLASNVKEVDFVYTLGLLLVFVNRWHKHFATMIEARKKRVRARKLRKLRKLRKH